MENRSPARESNTALKGGFLLLVRLAWLLLFAANLALLYYLLPRQPQMLLLQSRVKSSWPAIRGLLSLTDYGWLIMAGYYSLLLAFLGIGLFIAIRRSSDWMALFSSSVLICLGVQTSKISANATSYRVLPGYDWLTTLDEFALLFTFVGLLSLIYLFPDGRLVPRVLSWGIAAVLGLIAIFSLSPIVNEGGWTIAVAGVGLLVAGGFYSQVFRYYRFSTPTERQQVKWAVLGLVAYPVYLLTTGITNLLFLGVSPMPALALLNLLLTYFVLLLIPLTLAFSILRYRLWDIDILIRRTLIYGALTFTLAVVFFGTVTLLQAIFSAVSGQQSAVATVISTLLIAALFTPLRRRIQNDIDRRFFRSKYNAEQAIERFAAAARDETDLDHLTSELLAVVAETMQPESVSLWLRPTVKRTADGGE